MAVRPILQVPAEVLLQRAKRVRSYDDSLQHLIQDMEDTLQEAEGVGLAAPQIGVPLRICIIQAPDQDLIVLVNPEMVRRSGERILEEGCLSLRGYWGEVRRSEVVVVKGKDRQGKEVRLKAEGLLAQALEHELDHLNGVIYTRRLTGPDQLYKVEPKPEAEEVEEGTSAQ